MSVMQPRRRRATALSVLVAAVLGLAVSTLPVVPAAVAAGLPDLAVQTGSTHITVKAGQPFTHVFYVNNIGEGSAAAGAVVVTSGFPNGFTINKVTYTGPSGWGCTHTATLARCTNRTVLPPGLYSTRIRIDATASSVVETREAISSIDPGNVIIESNEGNNRLRTALNVVP
jgi:hypothetical protein